MLQALLLDQLDCSLKEVLVFQIEDLQILLEYLLWQLDQRLH